MAAMLSFGAPLHACDLDGGFGMHRFNPFQAAHSNAMSGSWNDALNQSKISGQRPEKPVAENEHSEEALLVNQKAKGDDTVSNPVRKGRRDDQQDFGPSDREGGDPGGLILTAAGDLQAEGAIFH
jgi:hypothetical protein